MFPSNFYIATQQEDVILEGQDDGLMFENGMG
jgi:hypothetical protein